MLQFDGPLSFREFMTHEELPLATLFRDVLEFLASRPDAVLFGAQAVNAYCETARMTHDIDLLSTDAAGLAEALRGHLAERFHIAVRVREVADQQGFRVYQVRKPKNRHLIDVRQTPSLPEHRLIEQVLVIAPVELIAMKVQSLSARRNRPKGDTDRADLRRLLLALPDLRVAVGAVSARLAALGVSESAQALWLELVQEPLEADVDDEY